MSTHRIFVSSSVRSVLLTSHNPNHTLNRTFISAAQLLDTAISTPPQLLCRPDDETLQEIPHALQAEIFQLENSSKFRVHLDPQRASNRIQLICHWEDRHLPSVPPIYVTIPPGYPFKSPTCYLSNEDYLGTEFLRNICTNLMIRIQRLPQLYSLTRLLEAWDTAVRKTFSPNHATVADISEMFGV